MVQHRCVSKRTMGSVEAGPERWRLASRVHAEALARAQHPLRHAFVALPLLAQREQCTQRAVPRHAVRQPRLLQRTLLAILLHQPRLQEHADRRRWERRVQPPQRASGRGRERFGVADREPQAVIGVQVAGYKRRCWRIPLSTRDFAKPILGQRKDAAEQRRSQADLW